MIIESHIIKAAATRVGFDACGLAVAAPLPQYSGQLEYWLKHGCQAQMHFMEAHVEKRINPTILYPGARTVISVLVGYRPTTRVGGRVKVAQYAYDQDYHTRIKTMLFYLIEEIRKTYPEFTARPFVDTAPIADKHWAEQAGLGWIGRNTLLINPQLGSYCNIGELVTECQADNYDSPMENGCHGCHLCQEACPNNALFEQDGSPMLDANKCASYHTIENRDADLPQSIQFSGYAFGCDCCQLVCPHNHQALPKYTPSQDSINEFMNLDKMDEKQFKVFVKHRAMNRIKYSQWQRNVHHALIQLANSNDTLPITDSKNEDED